jgi:tripartite-type tricarboxylate transporter receptor subunit TctC
MRILLCALLAIFSTGAGAQTWPARPARIVVPFPAGGPTDVAARVLAERLSKVYGQQFFVENRPGAGGNIGAESVAKSAPDGYSLLISSPGPQVTSPLLYKNLGFDPRKDFTPIIAIADMPLIFGANPKLPFTSVAELVDYARKNPGKLTFATSGNGTIGHLAGELFKNLANVDLVHVPYKGSAPALQDLLSGQVDLSVDNLAGALRLVQSGQMRALAITTDKRWPALGLVPTMQEAGYRGYFASSWAHLFGPARLPSDIVTSINRQLNEFLASEEGTKRLLGLGFLPVGGTPEDLDRIIRADVARWGPLITRLGVKLD